MHPTEEVMVGEQLHDKTTEGYLKILLSFPLDTSVHKNLALKYFQSVQWENKSG